MIDWLTHCLVSLQNFAAQIVYNRPDNPLQYLVDELERSREEALQVTKENKDSVTPSPDLLSWPPRAGQQIWEMSRWDTYWNKRSFEVLQALVAWLTADKRLEISEMQKHFMGKFNIAL